MQNHKPLTFQLSPTSYGQVRAIPLLLANELNSELERWFQNYKFTHLAINNLSENEFSNPLQLEYTYSLRTLPLRKFSEITTQVAAEYNLLSFHQLIKIIHKYIELSYKVYSSLIKEKVGQTILDFKKEIDSLHVTFHKKNFPKKLDILIKDLHLTSSLDYLAQINKIRNCLEHRSGIISEHDCDLSKTYMSIKFRYLNISTPEGEISPISNILGRHNPKPVFIDEVKKFRMGEKITFDFKDNVKLLFSINICFKTIVDGIYKIKNVDQEKTPSIVRALK